MNYIQYVFTEREADIDIRTYDARTFWQMIGPYLDTFPKFLKDDREKFDFYNCRFYVAFKDNRPRAVVAVTKDGWKHFLEDWAPTPQGRFAATGCSPKDAAWIWIAASTRGSKHHVRGAFPKLLAHVLNTYGFLHGRYLDKNAKRFWHHIAERDGYKLTNVMWPWGAEGMILKR